jgi:hypothetical protein
MSAQLLEVLFNHDPNDKRGSALNLRVNASVPGTLPEWQGGAGRPVAYGTRAIVPSLLAVGARIRWTGPPRAAVEVRAISSLVTTDIRAPILGELVARPVPLGANGVSERVLFPARGGWAASAPVGTYRIAWRWQVRAQSTDPWTDFALTEHDIYATLTLPAAPWTELPFVDANIALPWSDVLAIACKWAAGASNASEAALLITSRLFSLGPELFEYGCAVFGKEMYANSVLAVFDCSAFVERINGSEGNGRYINCTDCACIISTLANVLGARLWQSRMGTYVPAFKTRDIRTIGSTRWTSPCSRGLGLMFHEVAWSGNATEYDAVYDGSLLVNANLSPSGFIVPMLAAGLGFGPAFGGQYRSMLAQMQDQLICHPAPEERRCRALM